MRTSRSAPLPRLPIHVALETGKDLDMVIVHGSDGHRTNAYNVLAGCSGDSCAGGDG